MQLSVFFLTFCHISIFHPVYYYFTFRSLGNINTCFSAVSCRVRFYLDHAVLSPYWTTRIEHCVDLAQNLADSLLVFGRKPGVLELHMFPSQKKQHVCIHLSQPPLPGGAPKCPKTPQLSPWNHFPFALGRWAWCGERARVRGGDHEDVPRHLLEHDAEGAL